MNKLFASWFLLGLAAALPAQPQPESAITVLVFNDARVEPATLARAERQAARIHEQAGIQLNWVDCPLTAEELVHSAVCQLPPSPARVSLRILPDSVKQVVGARSWTLGFAFIPASGAFGTDAHICASCCSELASGNEALRTAVLAHAMARELGHLLLGTPNHSAAGLMHTPWQSKEMQKIAQGQFLFTPQEGATMSLHAAKRLSAEAPALTASR